MRRFDLDAFDPPRALNWGLISPAGRSLPGASRQAPAWPVTLSALREAVLRVAAAEPRTKLLAEETGEGRLEFRAHTRILGLPDFITVILVAQGDAASLAIYSRARYGAYDFGVNRRRARRWLKAIAAAL